MKSKKHKVAVIGTVGVPANYGGFETLAEHMISNLEEEYAFTVYCSGKRYAKAERKETYKGARLKYLPLEANGLQSIFYDSLSILHALLFADVLLILGVAGAWMLPFVKFFTNKKIVISIDGIEWKRDKWSPLAKAYLFWAESLAVKYSHIDISDNEAIQDYTAMRYGSLSRIIEYGADHTLQVNAPEKTPVEYPFMEKPYAFKVCRIEPENNVHVILKAFAAISTNHLVVVGNWTNSEYGIQLKKQFGGVKNISLLDPIYDQNKLDLLRSNASLYVHGHSAGGTNPSLVEAMYLGLPIVAYGVSYNRVTTEGKATYFNSFSELVKAIRNKPLQEFAPIGDKMKEIANRRYKWDIVANKYHLLFQEALATSKKRNALPKTTEMSYQELLKMELSHLKFVNPFNTL